MYLLLYIQVYTIKFFKIQNFLKGQYFISSSQFYADSPVYIELRRGSLKNGCLYSGQRKTRSLDGRTLRMNGEGTPTVRKAGGGE